MKEYIIYHKHKYGIATQNFLSPSSLEDLRHDIAIICNLYFFFVPTEKTEVYIRENVKNPIPTYEAIDMVPNKKLPDALNSNKGE